MLTHTITLSFSLSTTFNSLWKRQVQTLIEPEPDLAPALSVRPAVLSDPLRSMPSQPGSQQAASQAASQSTGLHPAGRGGPRLFLGLRYSRASLGSLGKTTAGYHTVPSPITAPLMQDVLQAELGGDPQKPAGLPPPFPLQLPLNPAFPLVHSSPFSCIPP